MERPADDILLLEDLSPLQTPVPKRLFAGARLSGVITSAQTSLQANKNTVKDENKAPSKESANRDTVGNEKMNSINSRRNPAGVAALPKTATGGIKESQLQIMSETAKNDRTTTGSNDPNAQTPVVVKRKRGRPRKDPTGAARPHTNEHPNRHHGNNEAIRSVDCSRQKEGPVDAQQKPQTASVISASSAPSPNPICPERIGNTKESTRTLSDGELKAAALSSSSDTSPKIISLSDWSLATVPNSPKLTGVPSDVRSLWVVLVGRRQDMVEAWHSSIVTERILRNHIKTGSGRSLYILDSPMNVEEMIENGFSTCFINAFRNGFPEDWKSLLMMELDVLGKTINRPCKSADNSAKTSAKADEKVSVEKSISGRFQEIDIKDPSPAPDPSVVVKRKRGRPRKYPRADEQPPAPAAKRSESESKEIGAVGQDGPSGAAPGGHTSQRDQTKEREQAVLNRDRVTRGQKHPSDRVKPKSNNVSQRQDEQILDAAEKGTPIKKAERIASKHVGASPETNNPPIRSYNGEAVKPESVMADNNTETRVKRPRGRPRRYPIQQKDNTIDESEDLSSHHEANDELKDGTSGHCKKFLVESGSSIRLSNGSTSRRRSTGTIKWGWGGVAVIRESAVSSEVEENDDKSDDLDKR